MEDKNFAIGPVCKSSKQKDATLIKRQLPDTSPPGPREKKENRQRRDPGVLPNRHVSERLAIIWTGAQRPETLRESRENQERESRERIKRENQAHADFAWRHHF